MSTRRAVTALRVVLGLYFVVSGLANLLHFSAFREQVATMPLRLWGLGYAWDQGAFVLPAALAVPIGWILPPLEVVQGVLLAAGAQVRPVATSMIAVLLVIVAAFGVFPPELFAPNTMAFNKDLVFVAALVVVLVAEDERP